MKKGFKILGVIMALALVIGMLGIRSVNAEASNIAKIKGEYTGKPGDIILIVETGIPGAEVSITCGNRHILVNDEIKTKTATAGEDGTVEILFGTRFDYVSKIVVEADGYDKLTARPYTAIGTGVLHWDKVTYTVNMTQNADDPDPDTEEKILTVSVFEADNTDRPVSGAVVYIAREADGDLLADAQQTGESGTVEFDVSEIDSLEGVKCFAGHEGYENGSIDLSDDTLSYCILLDAVKEAVPSVTEVVLNYNILTETAIYSHTESCGEFEDFDPLQYIGNELLMADYVTEEKLEALNAVSYKTLKIDGSEGTDWKFIAAEMIYDGYSTFYSYNPETGEWEEVHRVVSVSEPEAQLLEVAEGPERIELYVIGMPIIREQEKPSPEPTQIELVIVPEEKEEETAPETTPEPTPEVTPEPEEEETEEIEEPEIPAADAEEDEEEVEEIEELIEEIEEEEIPAALPQTGTVSVGLIFGVGAVCAALGVTVIAKTRRREEE